MKRTGSASSPQSDRKLRRRQHLLEPRKERTWRAPGKCDNFWACSRLKLSLSRVLTIMKMVAGVIERAAREAARKVR
jgi:hypothetical protein